MTTQTFEQFRTHVSSDKALQAEVAACFADMAAGESDGFDQLAELGRKHGFDFSAEAAREAAAADATAMTDGDLELVSGGSQPGQRVPFTALGPRKELSDQTRRLVYNNQKVQNFLNGLFN